MTHRNQMKMNAIQMKTTNIHTSTSRKLLLLKSHMGENLRRSR